MSKFKKNQNKLWLLLTVAILLLCSGFIFVSCGTDPQLKVADADKGAFSVLFTAPNTEAGVFAASPNMFSIADTEFTLEAWVKRKAADPDNLNGAILTRLTGAGTSLYVKDNEPKFQLTTLSTGGTSTFTVSSGATLAIDDWTHVAGILVNQDHSTMPGHPQCYSGQRSTPGGTFLPGGEAEMPHMDISIKGDIVACASTWDSDNPDLTGPQFGDAQDATEGEKWLFIGMVPQSVGTIAASSCEIDALDGLCHDTEFNGQIDDVRFWTVARTQSEIQQCMKEELGLEGPCKITSDILKGYWPLNEGSDEVINDFSGNGLIGTLMSPFDNEGAWSGAWQTGIVP